VRGPVQATAYLRQTGHVNAYTLTKAMTEQLIASFHSAAFPVAIVRPSIVGAIARAPLPGYFGNSAGATAYFMAYATGALPQLCRAPWTSTCIMLAFVAFIEVTTFRLCFKLLQCQDLANAMLMCCPHHLSPDLISVVGMRTTVPAGPALGQQSVQGRALADVSAPGVAGMATFTCHKPHHVFDVVPADVCAAVILATASALTQVRKSDAAPESLPAYQSLGWSSC